MSDQIIFYEAKLRYEIDSWDLFVALKNGEKLMVIDARSPEAYNREHIPHAVNIPHRVMNEQSVSHLDRSVMYVTYCDGIGCNASTKGALNMARLGFTVKELMGGIEWWKRDGYATEGAEGKEGQVVSCGC
ncbi:MAG: rhodanese-like domain-containing protein [Chromatiaceae bacterium]|nr:rhodanese-like domain-containing protein [Planctomycetales bacterium]MCP5306751.1 rhodanese-like domain-containing protein [Chromatiaceae bacterium]MCP5306759.1 rhodanese-like domain-containing protein [Chromatiaceae bacterium]MCP5421739.1 rhodanese-like domain-containing protein [Chromatiaceae bacterium]MCP5421747.1 rhodanese-like domain-containing protein [Chromatiaceae bacterium]